MCDVLEERFELSKDGLKQILEGSSLEEKLQQYFTKQASFLLYVFDIYEEVKENGLDNIDINSLKKWNNDLYADILKDEYEDSYANPKKAVSLFGKEIGQVLSLVAAEIRTVIGFAYEGELFEILIRAELLLELYGSFSDGADIALVKEIIYHYAFDYSEECSLRRVREMVDPSLDFATKIIMNDDLTTTDYLYKFGEYITDNEIKMSKHLASLSDEDIEKIASTYTEGYRIGFINTGKNLYKKKTVNIRYPLGMERVVRRSIELFRNMGLSPVIYRAYNSLFRRQGTNKIGYFGANPNKQYDFDHKEDEALFFDGNFVTRKLECLEKAFEEYKTLANEHAGPAVIESFGEAPYQNIVKDEALTLSEKQQKLTVRYMNGAGITTNKYIIGEERSFTIIAFPVPAIGEKFCDIFNDILRINTLEYELYSDIQQKIIDALDKAEYVRVKGSGNNKTDIKVQLVKLQDPAKETKFENCVADVNIPVGEVFTSPVLKGTEGILNVSKVFLNELEYKDLTLEFKDGRVTSYSCSNYKDDEKNKKYISDNILFHHETLPIGEFAIGTNTLAYVIARKYDIERILPILIAEKTGPHITVGDTCYSHEEDLETFNPDGKKIVARSNEISDLRKEDMSKAYFNCHTDITIPYDELEYIELYMEDGTSLKVIDKGRFVLEGTEELNKAFEEC